ncbi:hypothetical protein [Pseudonocardia sp. EC080610-09]|uniref:hypothetical protein n=1 Tax=Pseudonocardia sp. EC080610-09 TaxID=1688404 RepID=UPI00210179C7|nr:hypothetical protein [Pseudonocardia sp. EC080610-09]
MAQRQQCREAGCAQVVDSGQVECDMATLVEQVIDDCGELGRGGSVDLSETADQVVLSRTREHSGSKRL